MKHTLVIILTLMLFACSNKTGQKNSNKKLNLVDSNEIVTQIQDNIQPKIESATRFRSRNPEIFTEDTLILKSDVGIFQISPSGLLTVPDGDTVQLETDLIVERAYLYQDEKSYYIFFTDTDHDSGTSWLQKINKDNLMSEFTTLIWGFNLGQPMISGHTAFVTAIGFIGSIDLEKGKFDWKHDDLYDHGSFNSFDTLIIEDGLVQFISEHFMTGRIDEIIVEINTGEIVELIK